MSTQRDFSGEKGKRMGMKYPKTLIGIPLLLLLLVLSPIVAENPVSVNPGTEKQEKENKIEQAAIWKKKGDEFYKGKEYKTAIECYQKAASLNPVEIEYIINLARAYRDGKRFAEAEKLLNETLEKFPNKDDQKKLQIELADVHFWRAKNLESKYDHINAIKYYEMAYNIDKVHRVKDSAVDLNNIGYVYAFLGENQKALEYYGKVLPIWRAGGYRKGEGTTLTNIGDLYSDLGLNQKALEYYKKALPIRRAVGDREGEAIILHNIGFVYSEIGLKHKALEYYKKALPISQAVGNQEREARTLNGIGAVYSELGLKQKALEYFEKALPISQAAGDREGEATILNNNGFVYYDLGLNQKALEYFEKALPISQAAGDLTGKANTLNNIGLVYSGLGLNQKALEYYKKALLISQAVGDREGESRNLNGIGAVYSDLGLNQKALEYFEKALLISQAVGNQASESTALNNIGAVYFDLGLRRKALQFLKKALPISQTVGDREGEARTMNVIGAVYSSLGQNQHALEYFKKALPICQAVGDRKMESTTFNRIGLVYYDLGQNQKALEYYNNALSIRQTIGDQRGKANTLNNIGLVYYSLGLNQKALKYLEKALPLWQAVGSKFGEATILNNIGNIFYTLGRKQEALEYFEKALLINRAIGNRTGEALALNNIAAVYFYLSQNEKTLEYLEKALSIWRAVTEKSGEAKNFNNLMFLLKNLKKIRLSIFYGKQSVNAFQELRANISGFEKDIQRNFLESKQQTYRILASLLISEGRLSEAQQVLDMLKEEEYFNFIRKDRAAAAVLSIQVDFTEFEKQWLEKYNTVIERLSAISNEYHLLKFKQNKDEAEKKRVAELTPILKKAAKDYEELLIQLKDAFDQYEKDKKAMKEDIKNLEEQAKALRDTLIYLDENEGGRHAALHYLLYKGRISVILTTPSGQLVKQTEIDENEFNRMVLAYRNLMMDAGRGVHPLRHKSPDKKIKRYEKYYYDVIFKAVDEELKKYGATNLVVSLDGVLRYLPLGALWNGESYLLQRYRIAIVTPFSLKNIKDEPVKEKKILGLGASKGNQELPPLDNVSAEIRFIVKDEEKGYYGLIKGKAFIDNDFTRNVMVTQLRDVGYPMVHIASHFKFSPGDETKNHLLLGDGTFMKLSEIRRMGKLFNNVKLLVLSACQTGVGGNGEEIDGFGELAQQSGAKSVMASLWPVADESTKDLMLTFYGILKEGKVTSKIEALRQAQLELAGLEDLLAKDKIKTHQSNRQKTEYSHPYYWGPFIMIGNWR